MDVKVVVVAKPDGTCLVVVMVADSPARTWTREYQTIHECFTELGFCGLMSMKDVAKALMTDCTGKGVLAMFHAYSDPEVLRAEEFRMEYQEWVN